jgi:hypothetical protein
MEVGVTTFVRITESETVNPSEGPGHPVGPLACQLQPPHPEPGPCGQHPTSPLLTRPVAGGRTRTDDLPLTKGRAALTVASTRHRHSHVRSQQAAQAATADSVCTTVDSTHDLVAEAEPANGSGRHRFVLATSVPDGQVITESVARFRACCLRCRRIRPPARRNPCWGSCPAPW